jgi:acetaldehyde dehydrogenase/alcohol dehydrogenase
MMPVATPEPDVDRMVSRAVTAQHTFADWPEVQVDTLLRDIAQCIDDHAADLAVATVEETGLGNVADKTDKNRLASQAVYASLLGKPGAGLLRVDSERGIAEIASPMGVVFGLVPRTHPVATFVFKTLIALKGRNALILSCHRAAEGVGQRTGQLIASVLARHGAPADLVQWVKGRSSRETTHQFMRHSDVAFILATGGAGMVRAAYSSGTPAIGVGPGNAPVWVCADADAEAVADAVIVSKSYDNGIICASEHNLVVDARVVDRFVQALEDRGGAVLRPAEIGSFVATVFDADDGHVRRELHGQSAARLAALAGVHRPERIRVIVVPAGPEDITGPLGREKMAPVVSLFTVRDDDAALAVCKQILDNEGAGHTAIVHSHDAARITRYSSEIPASRILVNVPGTQGTLGIGTGLVPSMTLGAGTRGGSSTTDSVTYTHLLNIKRIIYKTG